VKLTFTERAWDDYLWWLTQDRTTLKRINRLIEDAKRDPFDGIGKPEPLKHTLAGAWSRRITEEHRLVYLPQDDQLTLIAARYHYE
jgi:toxin YoeB